MENLRSLQDFYERRALYLQSFYETHSSDRRENLHSQVFSPPLSPLSSPPSSSSTPGSHFFSGSPQSRGLFHLFAKYGLSDHIVDSERRSFKQAYRDGNGSSNTGYKSLRALHKAWCEEMGLLNKQRNAQYRPQAQFFPPYMRGQGRELFGSSETNYFTLASPDSPPTLESRYSFQPNMQPAAYSLRPQTTPNSPQSPTMTLSVIPTGMSKETPSLLSPSSPTGPSLMPTPSSKLRSMFKKTREDVWGQVAPTSSPRIHQDSFENLVKAQMQTEFKTLVQLLFRIKLFNNFIARVNGQPKRHSLKPLVRTERSSLESESRENGKRPESRTQCDIRADLSKVKKISNQDDSEKSMEPTVGIMEETECAKNGKEDFSEASYQISFEKNDAQFLYFDDHKTLRSDEIDLDVNKIITCEEAGGLAKNYIEQIMGENLRRSKRKRKIKKPYQYDQNTPEQKVQTVNEQENREVHSDLHVRTNNRDENFVVDDYLKKDSRRNIAKSPKNAKDKRKIKVQKPKKHFDSMVELTLQETTGNVENKKKKVRKDQTSASMKINRKFAKKTNKLEQMDEHDRLAKSEPTSKRSVKSRNSKNLKLRKRGNNAKLQKIKKSENPENFEYFKNKKTKEIKNPKKLEKRKMKSFRKKGKSEKKKPKPLKVLNQGDKKVPLQVARGLEKSKKVLIRRIEYRSGNICAKMEPYVGTVGVIVKTPIYPGTWYSVRMYDDVIIKCRSTSLTRNLAESGKVIDKKIEVLASQSPTDEKNSFETIQHWERDAQNNSEVTENVAVEKGLDKKDINEADSIKHRTKKSRDALVERENNAEVDGQDGNQTIGGNLSELKNVCEKEEQ